MGTVDMAKAGWELSRLIVVGLRWLLWVGGPDGMKGGKMRRNEKIRQGGPTSEGAKQSVQVGRVQNNKKRKAWVVRAQCFLFFFQKSVKVSNNIVRNGTTWIPTGRICGCSDVRVCG